MDFVDICSSQVFLLKSLRFILQGEGSLVITSDEFFSRRLGVSLRPELGVFEVSALEDAFGALHLCHPDIGENYEAYIKFDTTSECLKIVFRTKIVGKRLKREV